MRIIRVCFSYKSNDPTDYSKKIAPIEHQAMIGDREFIQIIHSAFSAYRNFTQRYNEL